MPWWGRHLGRQEGGFWLERVDAGVLGAQPLRRRIGYLNTLEDLLTHLGHSCKARRENLISGPPLVLSPFCLHYSWLKRAPTC